MTQSPLWVADMDFPAPPECTGDSGRGRAATAFSGTAILSATDYFNAALSDWYAERVQLAPSPQMAREDPRRRFHNLHRYPRADGGR